MGPGASRTVCRPPLTRRGKPLAAYPDEGPRILADPDEIERFHDRCSELMRALLDELARHPDTPRPFPEIEDAIGWPHRRIAAVLGGVAHLRCLEFAGCRPYHFFAPRDACSGRWEMWMDARQAAAVRALPGRGVQPTPRPGSDSISAGAPGLRARKAARPG